MSDMRDTPEAHEDLYMEIMEGASKKGTFVVETEGERPDIEFSVKPADKPTRNKLRRNMPSGMLDGIDFGDDVESIDDLEDVSLEDIDLSGLSIEMMTFTEEATEVWLDIIAEQFEHEYYSESEIRNMFDAWEDDYFITAGSYIIEHGSSTGPVTGFRRE